MNIAREIERVKQGVVYHVQNTDGSIKIEKRGKGVKLSPEAKRLLKRQGG